MTSQAQFEKFGLENGLDKLDSKIYGYIMYRRFPHQPLSDYAREWISRVAWEE